MCPLATQSRLDMTVMTLDIVSPLVFTKVGVAITVSSVAQVRVSRFPNALLTAASQFLDMSRAEIEAVAKQTLVRPSKTGDGTREGSGPQVPAS